MEKIYNTPQNNKRENNEPPGGHIDAVNPLDLEYPSEPIGNQTPQHVIGAGDIPGLSPNYPTEEKAEPRIQEYGGYTNIRSRQPGTMYESGMPLRIDTPNNPQTGDPQVPMPKLD